MQHTIELPVQEIMSCGHVACPGCGGTMAMRYALKALGEKTVLVIPACCWAVIDGPMPYSAAGVPVYHCAFETAGSTASGVKAGLERAGDHETQVVAWAGDGGTFDIGFQSLSGAAERNDDILYVCYDNEAYMNTGIQRSSATPFGAWTTTTPTSNRKKELKKNMVEVLAAHRIPYIATATVAFPEDLVAKVNKAKSMRGFKFIHILSPCPPGWKSAPELSVRLSRLAVETKIFPLFEIIDGTEYRLTHDHLGLPVDEYLQHQGRFTAMSAAERAEIQSEVDASWKRLLKRID